MASALTVANRILQLARDRGMQLTPLQLMKLVYMAQGWMLAATGRRLYDDKIEAWKYGPVIPALYLNTKQFGSSVISGLLPAPEGDEIDPEAALLLVSLVDNYGRLSGIALSNLTHRRGTPWAQVWREGRTHTEIPIEIIRRHYESLRDKDVVDAA